MIDTKDLSTAVFSRLAEFGALYLNRGQKEAYLGNLAA
jgi:hypothetical protein